MKEKYADTIQKKVDAAKNPPTAPKKEPLFFLFGWNKRLWPLFLSPLFTLIYAPVNRYMSLPLLGSGRPFEDENGLLVGEYFSANSLARILFYLLILTTEILLFKTTKGLPRLQRSFLLIAATLLNLMMGILFLEFTLWE